MVVENTGGAPERDFQFSLLKQRSVTLNCGQKTHHSHRFEFRAKNDCKKELLSTDGSHEKANTGLLSAKKAPDPFDSETRETY